MVRIPKSSVLGLAGLALLFLVAPALAQENAQPAYLRVRVPAGAELLVDGARTKQSGPERLFESPPIPGGGRKFIYMLKATWKEGGKDVVREQEVRVEAGRETVVDLRQAPAGSGLEAKTGATADTTPKEPRKPKREPDIFYLPTPQGVVDRILELAELKKDDVVYDLGCGDGRFVVTAAEKYGVKATGFDIDPERVKDSLENVKKHKVEKLVTIKEADVFELDLRDASVVTLYLLPELNERLMPQLAKLKPGSRILSHDFPMDGAKPKKVERLRVKNDRGDESEHTIYMWTVPWELEK
jgi:uncharacterized protein (TIGR03000 family)